MYSRLMTMLMAMALVLSMALPATAGDVIKVFNLAKADGRLIVYTNQGFDESIIIKPGTGTATLRPGSAPDMHIVDLEGVGSFEAKEGWAALIANAFQPGWIEENMPNYFNE